MHSPVAPPVPAPSASGWRLHHHHPPRPSALRCPPCRIARPNKGTAVLNELPPEARSQPHAAPAPAAPAPAAQVAAGAQLEVMEAAAAKGSSNGTPVAAAAPLPPRAPPATSAAPSAARPAATALPYERPTLGRANRPLIPVVEPLAVLDAVLGSSFSPGASGNKMPAFLAGLEAMAGSQGGPLLYKPTVANQPASADSAAALPFLLYLPGIDGTGLAAYRQFPGLCAVFDLHAVFLPPADRSSFEEVVQGVQAQLEAKLAGGDPGRPVYLLGESFGGLVALELARRCGNVVDRVVLVNPATSFGSSPWPALGPLLTSLPQPLYNALPVGLAPLISNPFRVALNVVTPGAPPPQAASELAWGLVDMLPELGSLRSVLPAPTLAHRLRMLQDGSRVVNAGLGQVAQRVLLLMAGSDAVLPNSAQEGPRLAKALPRCRLQVLPGRSHALLQESGVDLVDLLRDNGFYVQRRMLTSAYKASAQPEVPRGGANFGRAMPLELPTAREIEQAVEGEGALSIGTLTRLTSPVFLSTTADGRVVHGLAGVPSTGPVLLIGNHQLFAPDMAQLVVQFLKEKQRLVRGLAHPFIFGGMQAPDAAAPEARARSGAAASTSAGSTQPASPLAGLLSQLRGAGGSGPRPQEDPGTSPSSFGPFLTTFGAVPVSGFSLHRLLSQGEMVLLYPGGAREALKYRDERYSLIWPDKSEFVRMAARLGATIVPFAAVGAEDSINQVLDSREVLELPFIGQMLRDRAGSVPQARRGVAASEEHVDTFVSPFVTFNAPSRHYFLFQQPISLSPDMAEDKAHCDQVYAQVRGSVDAGLSWLLRLRERDPYKDLLKRLAYELPWRGARAAPTFSLPGEQSKGTSRT